MKYSDLKDTIVTQYNNPTPPSKGSDIVWLILGQPGGGKSALAVDIVHTLGGTDENTVVFVPSLRDPVDVLGTPRNNGVMTEWVPPSEFYKLRHIESDPDRPCFLVIEEMSDASMAMMNAMCRIVHERYAGDLKLARNLFIIGTSNRTQDKSGANRLSTKLSNRLNIQHFDENLDDWVNWAINRNLDPVLIQFLRFKPNLLSDFDANREYGINPTPRAWEKVAGTSLKLGTDKFMQVVKGLVGEGAAAEYTAFRKIYDNLISFEEVVMNPTTVKIPKDLSAQYAIVGSVSHNTTPANIERVAQFVDRLPTDFGVMFWQDTIKRTPAIKTTKPFIKWATASSNVVLN